MGFLDSFYNNLRSHKPAPIDYNTKGWNPSNWSREAYTQPEDPLGWLLGRLGNTNQPQQQSAQQGQQTAGSLYNTLYGDQSLNNSTYWQDSNSNNLLDDEEDNEVYL